MNPPVRRLGGIFVDQKSQQRVRALVCAVSHPGGRRPIMARLRRADGRAYGRPEGSDLRSVGAVARHYRAFPDNAEEMQDDAKDVRWRLLSPEDVARVCGLSRRAVYRAIARGELRAARLCNRLRVQPAELERWVGERMVAPDASAPAMPRLPARGARAACGRCSMKRQGAAGNEC